MTDENDETTEFDDAEVKLTINIDASNTYAKQEWLGPQPYLLIKVNASPELIMFDIQSNVGHADPRGELIDLMDTVKEMIVTGTVTSSSEEEQ